ncbi:ABC transporter substrate-binding protein [Noviherbaspirillum sedimenti]|uniref:ABC transporter substrate-binding protein n=1 Tax=Noviherbaspirillum sedimenti TaxID=2320865 RepID=A0A3A3G8C3_9BURK|nr:ABC transporter substrate-binding protein [Noviherbaspirillum sedimenti]RJG02812.1 ABC transporter substrate-binding protein [Noviherbaspirillum sedimenti]
MKTLKFATVALTVGLASAVAGAVNAQEAPFRIGVSNDQSGPYADQGGLGSVLAAKMAAEDFGGKVLGRKIEILAADNMNKPDIASTVARKWFDVDGVSAITDGGSSASGLAAQSVAAEKKKITLITAGTAPDFSGKRCSPYGTQWATSSYALANTVVKDLVQAGNKKWYFLTTDFVFGHALENETTKAIKGAGGTVLGSAKHPINSSDFASYLLQAQSAKPDVVAVAAGGADMIMAVKQAKEFGLKSKLVALYVSQPEVDAMGLESAQGLQFGTPFYWNLNDVTRTWARRFQDRHKKMPSMIHANTYAAVTHYLKAVQAAGKDDAELVSAKMREMPIGKNALIQNAFIMPNGRVVMDMHVAQVKSPKDSKFRGDSFDIVATLPGKQVFEPIEVTDCPLVKK